MPTSASLSGVKPPIHEQIVELQKKIQLLDGDHKAYEESSSAQIQKNLETIQFLRQENKKMHKKLADVLAGDEKVIKEVFQSHSVERAAMRNKSGHAAIEVMDQKLCDKFKRLNALHHQTEVRKKRLEQLEAEYKQKAESEEAKPGKEDSSVQLEQNLRMLENRLEKAQLKLQESDHIYNVYQKLKDHMQDESLTFQSQLDLLENEILRQRQEMKELEMVNKEAVTSRETARTELQLQEEEFHRERRERETILQEYKRKTEERRLFAEKDRKAQRISLPGEDTPVETQLVASVQEEEKAIHTYQEAFQKIKEATGVTDTQEVVRRFVAQGETYRHLEELKSENEKTLVRLKEEKERLQDIFQELKYSGEAKLSSGQQVLEELQSHLQKEEKRRDKCKEDLERMSKILSTAKSGMEHLTTKVQHIKVSRSHFPARDLSPRSDEYTLDLLETTEKKLQKLLEELDGQDVVAVLKQMEGEEFQAKIEGKLPAYNLRISLPAPTKEHSFEDEEDSGEDEGDVVTRAALKRQSQQIIESKTKRKSRPKKKKGKQ
ncbi:outer dynein arm-docking complex subunit 3 isoform X2 [Rana temporaria]|uniref:outer dynein arm-docking complex subunit 3 isoform X2 n=1 Tax=Rana temporaria TaxID=8407 RepID=UPI001AAD41E9|nr:outer dynein arm-docking complex subunit 3 isoform X2 [Rana temporaria]